MYYTRIAVFIQAFLESKFCAYEHEGLLTLKANKYN
jgi:hypothetical protein